MSIVLASGSRTRAQLMRNAGIEVEVVPSTVDERFVEAPLLKSGATPADIAAILAEAKAVEVSGRKPGALVIGADQVLGFGEKRFTKAASMEEARDKLLLLSGRTHELNSGVVVAQDGKVIWRHMSTAYLTMRKLSPEFIGHYMAEAGDVILSSVGCYQLEGPGIQLFEKIEGDYFTILGLPLLPLLGYLRDKGELES